jgi:hypothetical protein
MKKHFVNFLGAVGISLQLMSTVSAEVIVAQARSSEREPVLSGNSYVVGSQSTYSISPMPIAPVRRVGDAPIAPPSVMVIPSRIPYRAYRLYYPTVSGEYSSTLQYTTRVDGSGLETVKWSGQATSSQTSGYTPVNSRPQERKPFGVKFTPEKPTHNVGEYYGSSSTVTTKSISAGKSESISTGR